MATQNFKSPPPLTRDKIITAIDCAKTGSRMALSRTQFISVCELALAHWDMAAKGMIVLAPPSAPKLNASGLTPMDPMEAARQLSGRR